MVKLILLGGGKIGSAIAAMLGGTGEYQITVADKDADSLKRLPTKNVRTMVLDVADPAALRAAMKGHEIVVSAMPYHLTPVIAGAAISPAVFRYLAFCLGSSTSFSARLFHKRPWNPLGGSSRSGSSHRCDMASDQQSLMPIQTTTTSGW